MAACVEVLFFFFSARLGFFLCTLCAEGKNARDFVLTGIFFCLFPALAVLFLFNGIFLLFCGISQLFQLAVNVVGLISTNLIGQRILNIVEKDFFKG